MVGKLISTHAFWEPFVESQMDEWGLIVNNGQVMMRRTIRSAMKDHRPVVADHLHHPPYPQGISFLWQQLTKPTRTESISKWGTEVLGNSRLGTTKSAACNGRHLGVEPVFAAGKRCTILFCRCCSWRPAETGPFRGCIQPPRRGINSFESRLGLTCLLSV